MTPTDEQGVIEAIQAAHDANEPLAIAGRNSKSGLLRPVQAARTLSTANLTGITLYSPSELIIAARAGTTLAEIEAALAEMRCWPFSARAASISARVVPARAAMMSSLGE